jgi:hypothetical protein
VKRVLASDEEEGQFTAATANSTVMPGLDPGIHVFLRDCRVDGRVKPGHHNGIYASGVELPSCSCI